MPRQKSSEKNTRRLIKLSESLAVTLPIEAVRELGWREKQKVSVKKRGRSLIITELNK